jgi:hypothetical protein
MYNYYISGFEAELLMHETRKHLAYEYVPITGRIIGIGARETCVSQLSIYVILRGNEETRGYVNKVRNV